MPAHPKGCGHSSRSEALTLAMAGGSGYPSGEGRLAELGGALLRTAPMDVDRHSSYVERLEVVDTGRRRRWSEDKKLKSSWSLQAPRQVLATARRYGVSHSLLLRWRRSFRPEPKDAANQPFFVPALVVAEPWSMTCPATPASNGGAIEIEFATGARMRITGTINAATLKAVVAALADGRGIGAAVDPSADAIDLKVDDVARLGAREPLMSQSAHLPSYLDSYCGN